jgi:hypothetical protein
VRTAAESEPASASVRQNEVMISPDAMRGHVRQPLRLLRLAAVHDEALAADADIGADHRAERRARAAELDRHQALVLHREAEAAVLFRNRQAEEPEVAHRADDLVGNRVVLGDLGFQRPQPLGDEAADTFDQLVAGLSIKRHGTAPGRRHALLSYDQYAGLAQPAPGCKRLCGACSAG